jgi:DNA modification methylase
VDDSRDRDDAGHGHGTQKPVACMRRPMQNHVASDVYEPFAGSGTTVIAAEQLGRRCLAMEIAPRYAQIVIDRLLALHLA